jgi:hypothetical protein
MTYPASDVGTTNTDAGTDSPATARTDILDLMTKFNLLRNHISAFMQGHLADASAAAARATLGALTAGDNIGAADATTQTAGNNTTKVATTAFTTTAVANGVASKANDSAVVHNTGAESIGGVKTFTSPPVGGNLPKAWCRFDGTLTGTNAPTAGYGVTSVTRNGIGDYTINFTTAMADANYAVMCTGTRVTGNSGVQAYVSELTAPTTTAVRIMVGNQGGSVQDQNGISVVVFR